MYVKRRVWEIVEAASTDDTASRAFDIFILILITANVIAVVIGSVAAIQTKYKVLFDAFELFSIGVFTLEYLARLWSCTADPRYAGTIRGRLKHAISPMSIVDLIAIAPFYLPFIGVDLRSVRVLRLLRILRLAKIGRYSESLRLMARVLRSKKEELVLTTVMLALLLVVSSSLLYYCENDAQPQTFSSIPATMWWAIATLTTVGYGDIYPVTTLGKLIASVIAVLGIGMFALPTGILGAGFVEEIQSKSTIRTCPHCGGHLD